MLDNGEYFDNIKTIEYQITHTSAWEGMQQRSVKNKLPVLVLFNPHFSFNVGKKNCDLLSNATMTICHGQPSLQ